MVNVNRPRIRDPNLQIIPWREWIRNNLPPGNQGFVAEDLDLIVRTFSEQDPVGKFMLIELKHEKGRIGASKRNTFGLINQLLREADPDRKRYLGYYVLWYETEEITKDTKVYLNYINDNYKIDLSTLRKWLNFEIDYPSFNFYGRVVA